MSKELKEQIQRDIDEICTFGYCDFTEVYKTLILSRDKIEQQAEQLKEKDEELEQLKCYVNTVKKPSIERYEEAERQIEQLTKERDEYYGLLESKESILSTRNFQLKKQKEKYLHCCRELQSEKKKVKDIVELLEDVAFMHPTSEAVCKIMELRANILNQ